MPRLAELGYGLAIYYRGTPGAKTYIDALALITVAAPSNKRIADRWEAAGKDAPFGPGTGDDRMELYPGIIKDLGLPAKDTDDILSGNARRILGIK
ncbi:MAG: hypothetical protein Q8P44_03645 [Dehalococcoidia bacterium]|nr:hypothetical protein [Dehalococcoidia bacterium]